MEQPLIAPLVHPRWEQIASGEIRPEYRCLALKLMMIRIRIAYDRDPDQRANLAAEVHRFFVENFRFAAADHAVLFPEYKA